MGTIEKILNILKMKNEPKSYSVKFYAEMVLEDGRVLATEDDQFMIGSKVFAIDDSGEASSIEAGSYTMENGSKITIDENSKILDLGEEKEAEETEASEELAEDDEAAVDDWAGMEKRIKNLEDAVADLKKDKVEASAELSEEIVEEKTEEKTEMSSELIGELTTQIEELKSTIVELSGQPAEEGIQHTPEGVAKTNFSIDVAKMSARERASYYINSNK
jgi:hypothetical protein